MDNYQRTSCLGPRRSDHLQSQWEVLMRKFSHDLKQQDRSCKNNIPDDLQCEWRKKKTFATGSSYDGTWDGLGLCGYGRYTFPNGVIYDGEFEDSNFHGEGELRYPDGIILKGRWHHGELVDKTIIFSDGICYRDDDWNYGEPPDRRYAREYKNLVAAGKPNLTNEQPTKNIPDGTYDVGDGVYDPKCGTIHGYDNPDSFIRMPDAPTMKWLSENCRTKPDRSIGPCPHLYKEWVKPSLVTPQVPQTPPWFYDSNKDEIEYTDLCFNDSCWNYKFNDRNVDSARRDTFYSNDTNNLKEATALNSSPLNLPLKKAKPLHARISVEGTEIIFS